MILILYDKKHFFFTFDSIPRCLWAFSLVVYVNTISQPTRSYRKSLSDKVMALYCWFVGGKNEISIDFSPSTYSFCPLSVLFCQFHELIFPFTFVGVKCCVISKIRTYNRNGEYSLFISKCMKFGVYVDYDYVCKLCRGILDFKLSPWFEYCVYSFGYFPGVKL